MTLALAKRRFQLFSKGHPVKVLADIRSNMSLILFSVAKSTAIIVAINMMIAVFAFLPLLAMSPGTGAEESSVASLLFQYGIPAHAAIKLLTFLPVCAIGAAAALICRHMRFQTASDRGEAAISGALSCGMMCIVAGLFGSFMAVIVLSFAVYGIFNSFPSEAIELFAHAVVWLDDILEHAGASTDMLGPGLLGLLVSSFLDDLLLLGIVALVLGGATGVLIHLAASNVESDVISDVDVATIGGTVAMVLANFTYVFYFEDVVIFAIAIASCWCLFTSKTVAERVSIGAVCAIVGSMFWFSFFDFGYVTLLACAFWGGRSAARTLNSGLVDDSAQPERHDAKSTPELAASQTIAAT